MSRNRPKMLNEKREGGAGLVVCAILLFFILVILGLEIFLRVNFFVVEVSGESMMQTVHDGDYVYAQLDRTPQRG
ncbi:MAG: S26 family signal peptidase, partial [Clostridiales bacterium]|nr:S26 family signal peptidase [Clostridiales bacterium]